MATDADTWKYQELVGNARLVAVVDMAAYRVVSTLYRFNIRFNRILGSGAQEIVRLEPGYMGEPNMVWGSSKAGVDLLHPDWGWYLQGTPKDMVNVTCGGYARQQSFLLSDPIWQQDCVVTWRRQAMPASERLILTPPFKPEEFRHPFSGNIC